MMHDAGGAWTAWSTQNEADIARAFREAGGRDGVFVTTKVSPYEQGCAPCNKRQPRVCVCVGVCVGLCVVA